MAFRSKIAPHIKNQVLYYSNSLGDWNVESACQIDSETIRIFFRDKESKQLTSRLFPYLKDDKVDAIGIDNGDKIVDILK